LHWNFKPPQPFQSYPLHLVASLASQPAQQASYKEIGSQTLSDTLISRHHTVAKRNTQHLFLRIFLHKSFNLTFISNFIMGKRGKGSKTEAKAVKQAATPSTKEKDQQLKDAKAAQQLAIRKEKNLQRQGVSNGTTTTDSELMEERMKTGQEESQAKKAAARAQMLADQANCQQTDMLFRAAIAKSKLQQEKEVEEEVVAREALKARAVDRAKDAMKRKNEKSSRQYFPNFPLRLEGTVDPATALPIKQKHKNEAALSTMITGYG
jgi:hypothetical protein